MTSQLQAATEDHTLAADAYEGMTTDTARLRRQLDALARRLTAIDAIVLDTASLTGGAPAGGAWSSGSSTGGGSTSSGSTGSGTTGASGAP